MARERLEQAADDPLGREVLRHWADFPAIGRAAEGWLLAAWPEKSGEGAYDYRLELARAPGPQGPWRRIGPANEDRGPGEHGFVSLTPEGDGVRVFWLDGREMKGEKGSMTLRTALVRDRVEASKRLDGRVCDCCQTGAAATSDGTIVVFRDRSDAGIRDISIVRRAANRWTAPRMIARDDWKIDGCPVNGPAVAASARRVVVAWFTAAQGRPRVRIAFSTDGGASFGDPVEVDGANPAGRVRVALDDNGDALVSWVASQEQDASIQLRRVEPGGRMGAAVAVAATSLARSSGVPRIARRGDTILIAWVEAGEPFRLRAAAVRATDLPVAPR